MSTLIQQIKDRYDAADKYLSTKRPLWTEYEDLLHNRLNDAISSMTKSQVFDPMMSTLSIDRSARVMAQLASGKVKGISKNDRGAEKLMNLSLDKYILPNANAQFDFLTKSRMVNLYSNVYGNFFVLIDWDVRPNGYIGPDMWLIPIRDVFPQVGMVSLKDSDFVIVQSYQPLSYFERLGERTKNDKKFKNIPDIIAKLKEKAGDKQSRDSQHISSREQNAYPNEQPAKGTGQYKILSMYERDRWTDFVPSADLEMRDSDNPHDNGDLPLANKYSIPLLDDFMAMGDFERGKTMQLARNSLWNLYLDGVKISIFPPVLLDKDKISDKSSLKWSAAAKWMMKNGGAVGGAQTLQINPRGTETFNVVQNLVGTSLLNMFGTTFTNTPESQDPGFGRTPQALKMQSARENARDNVDRFYQEMFITDVYKKFVNLMSKKGAKIQFRMFEEEITQLSKTYPDIKEMYDKDTGKLTVDKGKYGSIIYDYEIIPGSTFAVDQQKQQENLVELFKLVMEGLQIDQQTGKPTSPLLQALDADGKEVKFGEMFTRLVSNSGIQDWDKIIVDKNDDPDKVFDDANMKFAQVLQTLLGAGGGSIPTAPAAPNGQAMPPQMPQPGMPMPQGAPQQINGQQQPAGGIPGIQ